MNSLAALCVLLASLPASQEAPGTLSGVQILGRDFRSFPNTVTLDSRFGEALARVGDLDGNGTVDWVAGAPDHAGERGSVWVLLRDGEDVSSAKEIAFGEVGARLGASLASLGDLDGDGTADLVAGSPGDGRTEFGGVLTAGPGSVWIYFLRPDGSVRETREIEATDSIFGGQVDSGDRFGEAVATLGDLDGDGLVEVAVGASGDDTGGTNSGAVWVLSLAGDGTVSSVRKLADDGAPPLTLDNRGEFGAGLSALPDVDGDGVTDLGVGAPGTSRAIYVLFMNTDGSVRESHRSPTPPGLGARRFGESLTPMGDLDGNGVPDLAVGAPALGSLAPFSGFVFALFLEHTGASLVGSPSLGAPFVALPGLGWDLVTLEPGVPGAFELWTLSPAALSPVSVSEGSLVARVAFQGTAEPVVTLEGNQHALGVWTNPLPTSPFGGAIAPLGDLDGDGYSDLAVAEDFLSLWIFFGGPQGSFPRVSKISRALGQLPLFRVDALESLGDLDGNGTMDLLVMGTTESGGSSGVVITLETDGSPRTSAPVFPPDPMANFPRGYSRLGDLDGDGSVEVAFLGPFDNVLLYSLDATGVVAIRQALSSPDLMALTAIGDLDGDGVVDLAVSQSDPPRIEIAFLNRDGSERERATLDASTLPFEPPTGFGTELVRVPDLDTDGRDELALFTQSSSAASVNSLSLLFLEADGSLRDSRFYGSRPVLRSLGLGGDANQDGVAELALGIGTDDPGFVSFLFLEGWVCADFESSDAVEPRPLPNGQAIAPGVGLERLLEVEGISSAGLGAGLFDSTPDGPNASSSDPDLLVDRGNVLILQENPTQNEPDVFAFPDDAGAGGTLVMRFPKHEVEPHSLDLIDIDPGGLDQSVVVLTDAEGRLRVYDIPSGWTEDVAAIGPPGWRTLDLRSLDPQPGYQAVVTASQEARFDPGRVVTLEVILGGSGAVDRLIYDPGEPIEAAASP